MSVLVPFGRLGRIGFEREVRPGGDLHQHLLFAINQCGRVVASDLKTVAMGDGVGRAGFDAVSAEMQRL